MRPKTRRRLLRLILIPIIVLVLLVGVAFALLYSQQQRLVGLALKELNKKFPGELAIGGSTISLQNLPYISIALDSVQFYPRKSPGTLPIYEAGRMFVGFSIQDILNRHYRVKIIVVKNGHLDLVQQADGQLNIVEASHMAPDTAQAAGNDSAALHFALKKIVLKNMAITYSDPKAGQNFFTHIDRIQSSFFDNDRHMKGSLDGSFLIDLTTPGDTVLLRHKHVTTNIQFSYAKATGLVTLSKASLQLENALFNISGTADLSHDNMVDLQFEGAHPDLKQLFAFAPDNIGKQLEHFHYDGVLGFKGSIKGPIKKGVQPHIELRFSCTNGWLHNTRTKKNLDSLAFTGYYTNGDSNSLKTSLLRMKDMYARPGQGIFKGSFSIHNFSDPKIRMQISSDLELGFFGSFLGIKDLERITGRINLKMNIDELVDLSEPETQMSELSKGVQSELTVHNLTFRIPGYRYTVDHLNLHANMKQGFVKLDSLVCNVGHSDLRMDGSLEDLPAIFHDQQKPISLVLNIHSRETVLHELFAKDSTGDENHEELRDFNLGLSLQTSVDELRHPRPLPRGQLSIHDLSVSFKKYPHDFHNFGGNLTINDTSLLLRHLTGHIDSSDIRFSGKVVNYALWFDKVKKGRTTVAFDFKSNQLAVADVVGPKGEKFLPKNIYNEVGSNLWLRSKWQLRYDSVFRFANIKIANISAAFQQHPYRLDSISGRIKLGTDHFIRIDTLRGKIGNSDFDLSMRLYTGKDTIRRKRENYLRFASRLLDVDQLSNYAQSMQQDAQDVSAMQPRSPAPDSTRIILTASEGDPAAGRQSFNVFQIPFIDFNASVNIGHLRYHRLGIRNLTTTVRMQANQQLYLDTLTMHLAGGYIGARAHFNGADPNKIYLRSRLWVQDVDLRKLMLKADYYGQDFVINKNIQGTFSGVIRSYVQVHPDLTPMIDRCQAKMQVEIRNGQLINFAPMQALSSYFSDKNLMMVRFDTLRNVLSFKNGELTIPDMNINSSLGFMEIAGTQSMDMHMDYYLRIPLKLVTKAGFRKLFGKKQEEVDPDQVDAIEYRDKDKRVHFINLHISGLPDNYKFALGKAKGKLAPVPPPAPGALSFGK
ncbi:MAG TPA: AsmA-like C-terminal region-containing protein [Puia sp.]|nr:AsmA-like C-terminal region-containing protein [Puia sp.]